MSYDDVITAVGVLNRLFGKESIILRHTNFQLLFLAGLFSPLGTGVVSPILSSLTGVFSVSASEIGLFVAAITAPGIVLIPIVGILTDRFGRKAILVVSLALFGSAGTAIAFTTDFRVALALRLIQGIGFSGLVPTIITSIGDIFEGTEEAAGQGIRLTGAGLSQLVFPIVSGVVVAFAWQYPFFLYALSLPLVVVLILWFEEPAPNELAAEKQESDGRSVTRNVISLAVRRHVWPVLLARGLPTFMWIAFLTYNSVIVVEILGDAPSTAGLVVASGSTAFAVAASQSGRITTRFSSRFYPLITGHALMAVGYSLFAFAPMISTGIVGAVLGGFGFGLTSSLYRSVITGRASSRTRGGLVSIGEALGRVGATMAPVVMGVMIEVATPRLGFGLAMRWTMFTTSVAISVAGGLALFVARQASRPSRPPVEEGT